MVVKILIQNITKKLEYLLLSLIILLTVIFTTYYNYSQNIEEKNLNNLIKNIYLEKTFNNLFNNFQPRFLNIEHQITEGESLTSILNNYSINENEIKSILKLLSENKSFKNIKSNNSIKIKKDQLENKIQEFSYKISKGKRLVVSRDEITDELYDRIISTKLTKKILYKENVILNSLYQSAINEKIPASIIVEFARIYGFEIDFQRDIRKNDYFQILFETFTDENNNNVERGQILFANLNLSGVNYPLYFLNDQKYEGHYDENGKSIIKTLMKTPINGARLSSPFGMRKHPIDGFNKMHRGTDFAAPLGTPIVASGDGIITKSGWCGGGGNCVKIKHNSTYQTVYAHMSKFASGVKKGVRVKQGQVIGYVGSTGKSTGPHLHYEVIVDGKRVNSQTLKLPSGKILKGDIRKKFETQKIKLNVLKSEIIIGLN